MNCAVTASPPPTRWRSGCTSTRRRRISRRRPEIAAYLRGETLHGTQRGWTLLTVGGLSLGWVRGADGILKNQYPKGLRRLR